MSVPHVAILMATYQGAEFIARQIDSLDAQRLGPLRVLLSDDSSTDATLGIVRDGRQRWKNLSISIVDGPACGAVENFRHLVLRTDASEAKFFAYCDQDDIWHPDKLVLATAWLSAASDRPALFCSRTRILGSDGTILGLSPLFSRPPEFRNAIVQSIAGGNTMVMNRAAFEIIQESLRFGTPIVHDWWTYMIVSGAGGLVHYERRPLVDYRQHAGNLIGSNNSWRDQLRRVGRMIDGTHRSWNRRHLELLVACDHLLTPQARTTVLALGELQSAPFAGRLRAMRRAGLFRQTRKGQIGLVLGCAAGLL